MKKSNLVLNEKVSCFLHVGCLSFVHKKKRGAILAEVNLFGRCLHRTRCSSY